MISLVKVRERIIPY